MVRKSGLLIDGSTLPIIEQISEGIPGGFFVYHADEKEELIYFNQAMLRIFGCDTEEEFRILTGNSFKGIVHPDDLDKVETSIFEQIRESQYNLDYVEYRIVQKDGTVRWIEDYGHFMHTEEYGDIFYVFIDDATDRLSKRMAELEEINMELRKAYAQEVQYRKAILHDAAMFFEIDVTKDEFITSAAQVINGKIVELFGFAGIPHFRKYTDYVDYWARQIDVKDLDGYREFFDIGRLKECYEKGELEQTYDTWMVDVFGRRRLFQYTFLLGRSEITGNIIALSIAKDITEAAEHQRLFGIAMEQAKAADIARNTFLSSMSHDIKTPLNGIFGYTDLMLGHMDDWAKLKEYISKIRLSGKQLGKILDESLELTRMESGKAVLAETECNLADILGEVEKTVLPEAGIKGIHLLMDKSQIAHFCVMADALRVKEILCQLLDNAVKYTPEGGEVSLLAEEVQGPQKACAKYLFVIKDTGTGIKEEFRDRLFRPFERENDTTQSGVFGSGLGLTVVKNLVDMMGGSIQVESKAGAGSVFKVSLSFRLQRRETPLEAYSMLHGEEVSLSGRRILLVEDNEVNREIEEELLSDRGMVVDTAFDGAVALEKVQKSLPGTYDVVLMDIQMPVMDGYESAKAIRALDNPRLANIPIIAVSANTFSEDQEKSLEAGMNAHCPKPIDIENLYGMIVRVLGQADRSAG